MDPKRLALGWLVVLGLVAAAATPAQAAQTSCGAWQQTPSAPVRAGMLMDVSASSPTDAWAVGIRWTPWGQTPLAEHWDGHSWTRTPSDAPRNAQLTAVVAIAPGDAWAAGLSSGRHPWIEHWDGAAWHRVMLPGAVYHATINDLAATSSSDVWAVGSSFRGLHPRLLNFDGQRWRAVTGARPPSGAGALYAVSGVSAGDVWAVGRDGVDGDAAFAEHWDGKQWTAVPTGSPGRGPFLSVAAAGHADVWASSTRAEHWDGAAWSVSATSGRLVYGFGMLAASGPRDVWALGERHSGELPSGHWDMVASHWDGSAWTRSQVTPTTPIYVWAVAHIPTGTGYWAAGGTSDWHPAKPLILACTSRAPAL
jgi:hypothetical protein